MGIIKHTRLFNHLGGLIEDESNKDSSTDIVEAKDKIHFTLNVLSASKALTEIEYQMLVTLLDK